ncbi:MAG: restriction endonuclease subunit S [Paludibacteraceae bacterium]|nr:restriction endonuclease subunit S [Paludibacteraceae bacterium]
MQELEEQFKTNGGTFEEYRVGDLFDISTPKKKFNANAIEFGTKYRYVVRTSQNNGVRGFLDEDEKYLNPANTISFGQDTATIFYQDQPYFTGDKIKIMKFLPKELNSTIACYLLSVMNKAFSTFQWGQSSFNEKILSDVVVFLPTIDGKIAFPYIGSVIRELENERIIKLNAYLKSSGLENTELTKEEKDAVLKFKKGDVAWKEFNVCGKTGIFNINNTHSILQSQIVPNSGEYPYVTASENNNSVSTYVNYDIEQVEEGNSIMIGGKTLVITYQESDYFSNDSHNLACYVKDEKGKSKEIQLFLVSALYKNLKPKYSWGDSISGKKIHDDTLFLPITANGEIDWDFMQNLISAESRLAIRGVVKCMKDSSFVKNYEIENSPYSIAADPLAPYGE